MILALVATLIMFQGICAFVVGRRLAQGQELGQGYAAITCFNGYVPSDLNIGGGDYLEIILCMECGRVQGNFPLTEEDVAKIIPAN